VAVVAAPPPTKADVNAASKELKKPLGKRVMGHAEAGAISAAASPVVQAMGRGLKGFINGATNESGEKMTRRAAAMHGIHGTTKGDIASSALVSGLGVGILSAGRDGLQLGRAKKTVHDYAAAKEHTA
jgi:hypothetical protein